MISIKVDKKQVTDQLNQYARKIPYAINKGVNDRADSIKRYIVEQMPNYIDKPTRYTLNALKVTKGTKQNPSATVWFKEPEKRSSHYLEPLVYGGGRHKKGTELKFRGKWLVPGKAAQPLGYIDQYGNFKASILQQLRSYFGKAENPDKSGFTANSKQANKDKLAKMKRSKSGYKTIGGKVYFYSKGTDSRKGPKARQHLSAGIWQKSGIHGSLVKPVLMESRAPKYKKQFDFYGLAKAYDDKHGAAIMQKAIDYTLRQMQSGAWR